MNHQKSPPRLQGLSYGLGLMLGGVIVIGQSLRNPTDQTALKISCGIGSVCLLAGGWNLWRWYRGDGQTRPISLPEEVHLLPVDQQIEYLQRIMKMSLFAFPLLTLYITFELTRLEQGKVDSVMLWAPISMLYQTVGYWPAVSATPALGIFSFFGLNRRLKQLDLQNSRRPRSNDITRGRSD